MIMAEELVSYVNERPVYRVLRRDQILPECGGNGGAGAGGWSALICGRYVGSK